jgi:hypothetical protein
MRIAVIERFSAPSRNCDSNAAGARSDEVRTLWLKGRPVPEPMDRLAFERREIARLMTQPVRILRSLAGILADRGFSLRQKRSLVVSALATKGAPGESLAHARDAVRLLRSQPFDRIGCYSTRNFALVEMLSRVFGIPYREFLSYGTRYFGEFAFELLAVVPYAYWLHRRGRLQLTQACADTSCLYYFSPEHQELPHSRSYVPISEYPRPQVGLPV